MSARDVKLRKIRRTRAKHKLRKKLSGTDLRPRISVFRSSKYTYVQVISDESQKTIFALSTKTPAVNEALAGIDREDTHSEARSSKSAAAARALGMIVADKLQEHNISEAVYDRNGFKYQGRVKNVAEGIRSKGFNI